MKDNTAIDASGPVRELSAEFKRKAALTVASNAVDAAECAVFLAMLGLTAEDGLGEVGAAA